MTARADGGDRVAVVSGGSRGLGRELVERLLTDGWRVATFSRNSDPFVEKALESHEDRFWWRAADLADLDDIHGFTAEVVARFGRIDLLINNAGVLQFDELLLTQKRSKIESLITANLIAPITLTHTCARAMVRHGGGAVVNVSSINAIRGHRGVAVYSAAKAGLDGFSRSLARELGAFGIRVNSVVPGFFESGMTADVSDDNRERIQRRTPLGRLGTVAEIADVALFLGSEAASFITGQTIVVDGGITC